MIYKNIQWLVAIVLVVLLTACKQHTANEHGHEGHDHSEHNQAHEEKLEASDEHHQEKTHEHGKKTITQLDKGYELFIEMDEWVVGEVSDITIHITRLSDYKPLKNKEIGVVVKGAKQQSLSAHEHGVGIYHLGFQPEKVGEYQLKIAFTDEDKAIYLFVNDLLAFESDEHIPDVDRDESGLVFFSKEQAWKTSFNVKKIQLNPTPRLIKTSGEIMPAPGDEFIITALHAGTININNRLIEGKKIKAGEVISTISSSLIHENITNKYLRAKNEYEKARIDYDRAKNLIVEKLISEKEYLEAKLNFESAKNNFDNISKYYNDGNQQLKSPTDGYVRSVFVKEGQYIEEGQPVATIIRNKRILLKADIPQQYNHLAASIFDANFSPVYTDQIFSIKALNGERISYSLALPANSQFIPLYFEIDANPEIIPGSYAEIYLKSAAFEKQITVPVEALMEDQGNYYVFVQVNGEHYRKVYIEKGDSDGYHVAISSGLSINDVVVTQGTYQVYLASLGETAPAHTHSH